RPVHPRLRRTHPGPARKRAGRLAGAGRDDDADHHPRIRSGEQDRPRGRVGGGPAAVGGSQWRTVWNVVLPTARSGLATTVVLGMARGIGETAPILLVAGYARGLNTNPLHGWQTSL